MISRLLMTGVLYNTMLKYPFLSPGDHDWRPMILCICTTLVLFKLHLFKQDCKQPHGH